MMEGRLFIDGVDVYANYGVYITKDGLNGLVAFPPLKSVTTNDWQEEDGIEADLDDPVLDTRDFTIDFAVAGDSEYAVEYAVENMVADLLSDYAYHTFDFSAIGKTYTLRLVSQPKYEYGRILGLFSLKFADDFPPTWDTIPTPTFPEEVPEDKNFRISSAGYFSNFGIRVLSGTYSSLMARPEVKKNMLRNIPTVPGAIYGNEGVTFKSKDIKIQCLMRAGDIVELWTNWDALLYYLTRKGDIVLSFTEIAKNYYCYYNSCTVSEFNYEGKIWLKFTLTMTTTIPEEDDYYYELVVRTHYYGSSETPNIIPATGGVVFSTLGMAMNTYQRAKLVETTAVNPSRSIRSLGDSYDWVSLDDVTGRLTATENAGVEERTCVVLDTWYYNAPNGNEISTSDTLTVLQECLREPFVCVDGVFGVKEDGVFGVLKE